MTSMAKICTLVNENIRSAVALWISNPEECIAQFGHISDWDTSQVTDMSHLFAGQTSFNTDISRWNVSNVTTMEGMFDGASSFNQSLSQWDVSKVTTMSHMFHNAIAFNKSLNHWNVCNVRNVCNMFVGAICFNRPLTKWNDILSQNIPNLSFWKDLKQGMTSRLMLQCCCYRMDICSELVEMITNYLPLSLDNNTIRTAVELWQTDRIECNLTYGRISNWDTSQVTNMKGLFKNVDEFNEDISEWNVQHVITMSEMFLNALTFNQPLNKWNVQSVIDMSNMFLNATGFNQPLNDWNVRNVTNMSGLFYNASLFNQPLNHWHVDNVTTMSGMFKQATVFNQPLHHWSMKNVTTISDMFMGATSFNQPLDTWNLQHVTNMSSVFYDASMFNQPLDNWNVSKVVTMRWMFCNATSFNQPLNTWNTSQVIDMRHMFYNATMFNQPLDNWNIQNVVYMACMFEGASIFNQPLIDQWNMQHVYYSSDMFTGTAVGSSVDSTTSNTTVPISSTACFPYVPQVLSNLSLLLNSSNNEEIDIDFDEQEMEKTFGKHKPHINCVVVGDTGAGKSALSGHLIYLLGRVDKLTLLQLRQSNTTGIPFMEYAWLADGKSRYSSRKETVTTRLSRWNLLNSWNVKNDPSLKYTMTLINVPGHASYFKEMLTGLSQSDAAIMVIDTTPVGFDETWIDGGQIKEQLLLLYSMAAITSQRLIIALNKMDECDYSQLRYNEVKAIISLYLNELGYDANIIHFIPVSGGIGDNLKERSANMPWYDGVTLIEALCNMDTTSLQLKRLKQAKQPFRLSIQEAYRVGGVGRVAIGRIETGILKPNMPIYISPFGLETTAKSIEMHHERFAEQANPGQMVGICCFDYTQYSTTPYDALRRGDVLVDSGTHDSMVKACGTFQALLLIIDPPQLSYRNGIRCGYTPMLHCHTTTSAAIFRSIDAKVDLTTGKTIEENPKSVKSGDACLVTIRPEKNIMIETYAAFPSLGRFCLRDKGRIIAIGIVKSIVYEEIVEVEGN